MRIALCISGQMRNYTEAIVQDTLREFIIEPLKPDIFLTTWDKKGLSHQLSEAKYTNDEVEVTEIVSTYPPLTDVSVISFDCWLNLIDHNLAEDFKTKITSWGQPLSAIPQLYQIWYCNQLRLQKQLKEGFVYDVVIRIRPDSFFLAPLPEHTLISTNTIYHLNTGRFFWANRVYDIFFYGNNESMNKIADAWINIREHQQNPFNNGLDPWDACRLLFLQTQKTGLNVVSLDRHIGDVYRHETREALQGFLNG